MVKKDGRAEVMVWNKVNSEVGHYHSTRLLG